MTRTIINPGTLSAYARARGIQASPAVRVGDLIFVSGFPPFGETGDVLPASVERQTEIVLDHMRTCLEAAGSSLAKVAKCNVHVDDVAHFAAVNRVYNRYFPVDPPASSSASRHGPAVQSGDRPRRRRLIHQRRVAISDHTASTAPNGQAPCRKPYSEPRAQAPAKPRTHQGERSSHA
jgi:2-iminobutanoate/2-iminopropanoate deaminase